MLNVTNWPLPFAHHPGGRPDDPQPLLTWYWLAFTISISAFVIEFAIGREVPFFGVLLHVVGLVPCGFAWLFARALFQRQPTRATWPLVLVGALFLVCLIRYIDRSGATTGWLGYLGHLQVLLGSAVLILTVVEAFDGRDHSTEEQWFRRYFVGGHLSLVAASIVVDLPEFSAEKAAAQAALATIALVGAAAAFRFRCFHPLRSAPKKCIPSNRPASQPALAEAIERSLVDQQAFRNSELKVAELAAMLEQAEYRVSQCIVHDLGYRNFNQMVNTYRIRAAKSLLADPARSDQAILAVALECGFASLGPFNRSFKAQTGMTPSAYRRARQATRTR